MKYFTLHHKMKNTVLLKLALLFIVFFPKTNYAVTTPPIIKATGNQIYCSGSTLKIVETLTITNDPAEPLTDAMYIQISSGYVYGQDLLSLSNVTLHPTIITNWDATAGKLKLYNPTGIKIPYTDFVSAIKDVVFSNSATNPSGIRNFSITIGQANYLPSTGHYYQYVANTGISWTAAKAAAEALDYYGLKGYLATISALDEAKISGEQANGAGWIGGSDSQTEGTWKWVTGPEGLANGGTGTVFWYGLVNGSTPNFAYWNTNEPNQYNGAQEDYAHITAPGVGKTGSWNDLTITGDATGNYQPKGYIVEYGGMPGDPTLEISASTTVTIPRIESTTSASICGPGSVLLSATATNGTVNWYSSSTGGSSIATGNSYSTPTINTTTSYFVDATNGNCPNTTRTEIIATIKTIPSITTTIPASRCDSGTVTLSALASAGTINWYDVATNGTSLSTGTSFTTPAISTTKTYYVDATANGCTSTTRTAVTATVNISPTITSTTPSARCDSGVVTIGAVSSTGTISWYDSPTAGILLHTGNTYTTPIINTTTTYYAEAFTATCTNQARTPVIATINNTPTITSTAPASVCDSGTLTLSAVASAGNIRWYDTAGNLQATGNSFTTPIITATTTYYAEVFTATCINPTRSAVIASVHNTPIITSTTPNSRCDSGTVTLEATSSAGDINWYDTSGRLVHTGTNFTTPNLTSSTTYFVDTVISGCSSPKTSITATVYPVDTKNEELILCQGETITLDASVSGMNYIWLPNGETTQTISVSTIGNYSVNISSPTVISCDSKKNISVIELPAPSINSILVKENSITIELVDYKGYYEFSINGTDFQVSNQFSYIPSGQHTAYVRDNYGCNLVSQNFTIFTIAKYFTPNNDGINDFWVIKEMQDYPNSKVEIFNRYGKLLKQLNYSNSGWNGTFNGVGLPADDYWYHLKLDDTKPEIRGHFTLKR